MVASFKAGNWVFYTHDGLGQRVKKAGPSALVASGVNFFVYDEAGKLLGEYFYDGTPIREYVYLGEMPIAVLRGSPADTEINYVYTDQIDRPWMVTTTANVLRWRWDTEPFGSTPPNANPSGVGYFGFPLRFPGQYYDAETGLHYNYYRDYDPQTGRYLQPDPIGAVLFRGMGLISLGAVGMVQPELSGLLFSKSPRYNHLYSYVASSPLAQSDPLGLFWPWDCYKCFKCRNEMEEALKKCRKEYDDCKTLEEQIEYMEKYGGGFVSTAIYNCATQTNPDAFSCMIRSCGACGANPKGPWPRKD
jgi:RHS repeat-associated protein